MISTELLTEVLEHDSYDKDCDSFKILEIQDNEILISYCYPYYDNWSSDGMCDVSFKKAEYFMNVHELAHKCKIWARDNEFFLKSFYDYEGAFCYISAPAWVDKIEIPKTRFCSETEFEAIFKACEYILEKIKEQNETNNIH